MIKRFLYGLLAVFTVALLCFTDSKNLSVLGVSVSADTVNNSKPIVIIDAGHGGFDGGAVAFDGTVEKELNLEISLKLQAVLESLGYETVAVRTTDTAVNDKGDSGTSAKVSDIKNRVKLMKKYPNAVFVSIHMNKYSTTQPHGAQVFYSNSDGSKQLAENIQNSVANLVQPDNHRVIKATTKDIYLLSHATIPSVIVECGFLSNPEDLQNLKDEAYQLKLAVAIAAGILK